MKMNDIEKIAHYSELAWTISKGNLIRNESGKERECCIFRLKNEK